MKLSLELPGNQIISEDVSGPGGEVRFAVGEPGVAFSGTWRLWANKKKSDIYLAARSIAGYLKISLHESGEFRMQWANPQVASKYAPDAPHPLQRWTRPEESGSGWTIAMSILVLEQDLVSHKYEEQNSKEIVRIPRPPIGRSAAFHVFIASPDQGAVEIKGFVPIAAFTLANGKACVLCFATHETASMLNPGLSQVRDVLTEVVLRRGVLVNDSIRGIICGTGENGRPMVFDLAINTT